MKESSDSLIVRVLQHYFPDWEPPVDRGREWTKALCPFHGESNPSATVSFEHDAFKCFACGTKGDAIGIIMREEGISYQQAVQYAEQSLGGQPREPERRPSRRKFGEPRSGSRPTKRQTPW